MDPRLQQYPQEQKEPELAALTHDVGGAINFNSIESQKNMGMGMGMSQGMSQGMGMGMSQGMGNISTSSTFAQQPATFDKNKPSIMLDKNNLVQLEPELKAEIVNHAPLHHTSIAHDASKPVLTTPTDNTQSTASSTMASAQQTIQMMRDQAVARAEQIAASVSVAASNLKAKANDKLDEMKTQDTSASTVHHMQPALKEEIVHHPTLNHVQIEKDHSAPVLNVPTDRNIAPEQSTLSKLSDVVSAKAAPIGASISAAASSAAASVSSAASNLKMAATEKISEMKKEQEAANAPHYIQPALKEEIVHHPALNHVQIEKDHSAPVLNVPTDRNIAPQPSALESLSDLSHIAAAKAAPVLASVQATMSSAAASVSAAAFNLKTAATEKISEMKKEQAVSSAPHYIQPALKEEIVHHQPLHHVEHIADHSAPMVAAPTDSMSSGPIQTASSSSSASSIGASIAASFSHAGSVISHAAHELAEKAGQVGHQITEALTPTSAAAAAAASSSSSSASREQVRHPTPMHPDVVLHPGPIDLSNVQSTLPADLKETNLLNKQSFDAKQVEVHNGGIAWSLPLDQQPSSSSSSSSSSQMSAERPHTVSAISTTPNSTTYSTLSTTPSTITYTSTTTSVETIPASSLNQRL